MAFIANMDIKIKVPKVLKSVRYSLAVVNGILLITGFLLIIVGIVVLVAYRDYELLITKRFLTIPGFVIATGAIIFFTAALGFYGAISEKFYVIAAYVVLLVVILIFEVSIVISSYALKNGAASEIRTPMVQSLQLYNSRVDITKIWDELQMDFECCGVTGRGDYVANQIPVSCCHIDYGTISPFECGVANAYTTACSVALGEWLSCLANIIAISALVVTCLQILLTSMAGWLAWRSKFEEVELES